MNIKIKNILISIGCVLLYCFIFRLLPKFSSFEYLDFLISYVIMAIILIGLLFLLNKLYILKFEIKSFFKGLKVGIAFIFLSIPSLITGITSSLSNGYSFVPITQIICFIVAILGGTGFCEEILFRGIVQNLMYDSFGKENKKSILISIIITSVLFGLMHMGNITNTTFSAVIVQVLSTIGLGLLLGTIYVRCKNIWVVVFLHGFWDICGLTKSGFFGIENIYGAAENAVLIDSLTKGITFLAMYGAWSLFLLRKKKEKEYIENN